jgi:PAS domain S-box-containing protein
MLNKQPFVSFSNIAPLLGIMTVLYVVSLFNYLLFHSLVELISVVVASGIFILAWHSRKITKDHYLLFIGISYLFVGGIDMVHALSYKGMGVFQGYGANLPTQLWIAARYMEGLCLLAAPMFLKFRFRPSLLLSLFFILVSILLWTIFSGVFPDCFLEGIGLTPFKKNSEYLISCLLIIAGAVLYKKRSSFDPYIFKLLTFSIFFTILSELAFTFYISVFGVSNLLGHFFKLISFYLIYKAIIEKGLREPHEILFRDLQKSEDRYRSLFDNLLEGFAYHKIIVDTENRPVDYVFLQVNEAFERITGLKQRAVIGRKVTEVLPGIRSDSTFDWIGEYGKIALHGGELKTEQFSPPLGKWFSVSAYCPYPGYFVAVFEDITHRKEAEAIREKHLNRLQLLIEVANKILAADSQKTMLSAIVTAARELIGAKLAAIFHDFTETSFRIGAVVGDKGDHTTCPEGIYKFTGGGLIGDLLDGQVSLRLTREAFSSYSGPIGLPPNHIPLSDVLGARLSGEDGLARGVVLISGKNSGDFSEDDEILLTQLASLGTLGLRLIEARDEAEQRAREAEDGREQLKVLTRELERSNKDLEEFAYIASHDLQEPLRSVAGFLQLLNRRYRGQLDSKAGEFIDFALSGAFHMENLLRDLLLFSRVGYEKQGMEPVHLHEVLKQALTNLQKAIDESGAECISDPLPEINAVNSQIVQLFQNLIGNAIKFRGEKKPIIRISVKRREREWVIAVKDNGIGIDSKQRDRIFLIFQRLHRKGEYPGTGVGLAVCKKIVERHGGRIWVESEPHRETTFFFTLPVSTENNSSSPKISFALNS